MACFLWALSGIFLIWPLVCGRMGEDLFWSFDIGTERAIH